MNNTDQLLTESCIMKLSAYVCDGFHGLAARTADSCIQ